MRVWEEKLCEFSAPRVGLCGEIFVWSVNYRGGICVECGRGFIVKGSTDIKKWLSIRKFGLRKLRE
jgi:hypothetical protein